MFYILTQLMLAACLSPTPAEQRIVRHHWHDLVIDRRLYIRSPLRFYIDTTIDRDAILTCIHPEVAILGFTYGRGIWLGVIKGRLKVFIMNLIPCGDEEVPIRFGKEDP